MKTTFSLMIVGSVVTGAMLVSAQDQAYSTKPWLQRNKPESAPSQAMMAGIPSAERPSHVVSSKPWLHQATPEQRSKDYIVEPKALVADDYNTKKALRGEGAQPVFQIAPLK